VAVVNTSELKPQAEQFVAFLFSTEGQTLWAEAGFRPVVPEVVAATEHLFPKEIDTLYTVADLGAVIGKGAGPGGADLAGWSAVDTVLFGRSGSITKIYDARGAAS
jgi:sulfate/thiosulfate transport system substrate-binding protein